MKKALLILLAMVSAVGARGQACQLTELRKGSLFEMTSYDAKDKVTGRTVQTVTDVTTSGGTTTATMHQQQYDHKNKLVMENDYTMECTGGTLRIDMRAMMQQQQDQLKGMENMQVEVTADKLEMPADPPVGQKLPDATMNLKANDKSSGMTFMNMTMSMTERKVEAREKQTTPAGTFDCIRVAQLLKTENKAMGIPMRFEFRSVNWYSPAVGAVRTDSYRNEKLVGKVVLTKFVK